MKLIYIDPPYNTGSDSFNYNDKFNHSTWLTFMQNRLDEAKKFLRDDGVIFIQCDDNEQAYLKVLCDEIFGRENFVACFVWEKTSNSLSRIRIKTEYILCYEKTKFRLVFNGDTAEEGQDFPILNEVNIERTLEFPPNAIHFKTFKGVIKPTKFNKMELIDDLIIVNKTNSNKVRINAKFKWTQDKLNDEIKEGTTFVIKSNEFSMRYIRKGDREVKISNVFNAECGVTTNIKATSEIKALFLDSRPLRGAEALKQGGSSAAATLELEADKRGTPLDCRKSGGFFGAKGSGEGINPFLRKEKDSKEKAESTMLDSMDCHEATASRNDEVGADDSNNAESHNDKNNETTLFATPKPEALLKRIIEIATNKGDLVMDFFAGSGTTLAVAHKMQRRWIGIEQMDYVESITKERLKKVVSGEQGGVSKALNWQGGGGFIYTELMPLNAVYREKILESSDEKELEKLYNDLESKAFTNYRVDIQEMLKDKNAQKDKEANIYKEFHNLSLEEKKGILYAILDPNMDYVPYSEIEDKSYGVSDELIELNRIFYGEGENTESLLQDEAKAFHTSESKQIDCHALPSKARNDGAGDRDNTETRNDKISGRDNNNAEAKSRNDKKAKSSIKNLESKGGKDE